MAQDQEPSIYILGLYPVARNEQQLQKEQLHYDAQRGLREEDLLLGQSPGLEELIKEKNLLESMLNAENDRLDFDWISGKIWEKDFDW